MMKNVLTVFLSVALALLCALPPVARAQGEESSAVAAEQAGRKQEALGLFVAALQKTTHGGADDKRLRERIVSLVRGMSSPPLLPEQFDRYMARGRAAVKHANTPNDFADAAAEFEKAARLGPWVANVYFNLGIVNEKAGKYDDALRNFELYLLAAPGASDVRDVKASMYDIEFRRDKQRKEELDRIAKAIDPSRIAGEWCYLHSSGRPLCDGVSHHVIKVSGSNFEISKYEFLGTNEVSARPRVVYRGTVKGDDITGSHGYWFYLSGKCSVQEVALRGRIVPGANRIEMFYVRPQLTEECRVLYTYPEQTVLVRKKE